MSTHVNPRSFETSRSPTTNIISATLETASHKGEYEREENALRQCMHRSDSTVNAAIQTGYTHVCEHNLYCEKFQSQHVKIQKIDGQTIYISRRTSLQHKREIGMGSILHMERV